MRFDRFARMRQRLQGRRPRYRIVLLGSIVIAILSALLWQRLRPAQITIPYRSEIAIASSQNEPIQPIPLQVALDSHKVQLGKNLFADKRLSVDRQVSCLSCHRLDLGGADRKARSIGANGVQTNTNTPTIFNVAYNFRFSWNGKFETLEAQIEGLSRTSMGRSWDRVLIDLQKMPDYVRMFEAIYVDGITQSNAIDALAVYTRSLYTPNSRFDRFLRGDRAALTVEETEGYRLFKSYGCVRCHQGVNVGGNLFQKFGVLGNYFHDRGNITTADYGRYNATGSESDRYAFRVPSLRNVALTPPYFHDGTVKTLEEAISVMAKYQLGQPLPRSRIRRIAQFLKTLDGEPPRGAS
jgi:cytochrome c peroxidase